MQHPRIRPIRPMQMHACARAQLGVGTMDILCNQLVTGSFCMVSGVAPPATRRPTLCDTLPTRVILFLVMPAMEARRWG